MAIFRTEDYLKGAAALAISPDDFCFICGDPLVGEPLIFWHGIVAHGNPEIWMHPDCAGYLGAKLMTDWVKVERWIK